MYLSLCLIVKDENSYIQEWLDYHILLGVEHFWIYDNDSKIPLEKTLKPYIEKGWVTLNQIHGKAMQLFAYDHCLQTYGNLSQWIGFIDTDEFIVTKSTDNLPDFLKVYERYGGVAMNCLFFGDSKQIKRPLCGQVAGYLMRTPDNFMRNRLIKTIVQPARVLFPISPHHFMFSEENFCVNELEHRIDDQFFPVHISKIQLNHYYTRSKQELDEKKNRGRGDGGKSYVEKYWEDVNTYSSVVDDFALKLMINKLNLPPSIARNTTVLTDPTSTKILDELTRKAHLQQPAICTAKNYTEISKREETETLLHDLLESMDYVSQGKMQAAKSLFYKLIQEYPFDLIHYTNFAAACINMNELPAAWEALSQAWKIAPRSFLVLKCMMDYFYAVGNYEQVEKCAILLNTYGDLEPVSLAGLTVAQWKQGKHEMAIESGHQLWPLLTPDMYDKHVWYKEFLGFYKPAETENHDQN